MDPNIPPPNMRTSHEQEPIPPAHPLLTLDNCLILPHIGSATMKTRSKMVDMTIKNILSGIENEKLPYAVNTI